MEKYSVFKGFYLYKQLLTIKVSIFMPSSWCVRYLILKDKTFNVDKYSYR